MKRHALVTFVTVLAFAVFVTLVQSCAARPRRATVDDVRGVMREPTSSLVTDCEGAPCLVLLYRNQLDASWVLLLRFNAGGEMTSATKLHLGPDAEPVERFDATEEFRAYLKTRMTKGGTEL